MLLVCGPGILAASRNSLVMVEVVVVHLLAARPGSLSLELAAPSLWLEMIVEFVLHLCPALLPWLLLQLKSPHGVSLWLQVVQKERLEEMWQEKEVGTQKEMEVEILTAMEFCYPGMEVKGRLSLYDQLLF